MVSIFITAGVLNCLSADAGVMVAAGPLNDEGWMIYLEYLGFCNDQIASMKQFRHAPKQHE